MRFFQPHIVYVKVTESEILATDYVSKKYFKSMPFIIAKEIRGRLITQSVGNDLALKEKRKGIVWPFFGKQGYVDNSQAAVLLVNHCLAEVMKQIGFVPSRPIVLLHFVVSGSEDEIYDEAKINPASFAPFIENLGAKRVYLKLGPEDYSMEHLCKEISSRSLIRRMIKRFNL